MISLDFEIKRRAKVMHLPEGLEIHGDACIIGPAKLIGSIRVDGDCAVTGTLVVAGLSTNRDASALAVMDPVTREIGIVTGLTAELRPIVTFDSGAVRSRSWSDLVLGEGRAW